MKEKFVIKDSNGIEVEIDINEFAHHIEEYHHSGVSIHEERGHYFTVDDNFGKWYLKLDNQDGITCHFFSKKDNLEGDEKFFQLLK